MIYARAALSKSTEKELVPANRGNNSFGKINVLCVVSQHVDVLITFVTVEEVRAKYNLLFKHTKTV